jgi:hypothetical protein
MEARMFLDYGFRSECCFAPIRMGKKKVKNTKLKVNIWICCNCQRKDVGLVKYNKSEQGEATVPKLGTDDEPVLD